MPQRAFKSLAYNLANMLVLKVNVGEPVEVMFNGLVSAPFVVSRTELDDGVQCQLDHNLTVTLI